MITSRYDGGDLRRVLAGMVTDTTVASRIASQWTPDGLFDAPWANLVAGWCVRHVRKYGVAPNGQLTAIYEQWADGRKDDETVKAVDKFLRALSDEHAREEAPAGSDYLLDVAGRYFTKSRIKEAMDQAEADMDRGAVEDAFAKLASLSKVELGVGAQIKPSEDYDIWRKAFDNERRRPLITYPGDLGIFFYDAWCRGELYAIQAPDKSGKSYWLLDLAYRGLRQRWRVLFVDAGDMTEDDIILRLGCRAALWPLESKTILVPTAIDKEGVVSHAERYFDAPLDAATGFKAFRKMCREQDMFRLYCYPNGTLSAAGLDGLVADVTREGWVPDIVVVDYADILAPPAGVRDRLDQLDGTWAHLRRISQSRHCLLITASQSSAEAYRLKGDRVQGRQHFSGRKTKNAYVNGMLAINVSEEDVKAGACRVNWTLRRKRRHNPLDFCRVAGCLDIASPAIRSYYR